ncbi:hypothetical protein AB0O20_27610 [Streptomyces kronopolitis]|uniref:hypothetical protein n=1 Tax=Streptomyces kronopolitis TaxID=1612435 RepID=UPI0034238E8E
MQHILTLLALAAALFLALPWLAAVFSRYCDLVNRLLTRRKPAAGRGAPGTSSSSVASPPRSTDMALRRWVERMPDHTQTGWHELTHLLYQPASLGRTAYGVRFPLLHRIHLIPGAWMLRLCNRYDRRQGLSEEEIWLRRPTGR